MIGWLAGRVLHHHRDGAVVLDVGGVGYEVHVAALDRLSPGESVQIFVYTAVREDAIVLYGFSSFEDRQFFELLLATPGVGPSTALAALRTMGTDELAAAIEADDVKKLSSISGIGPKTAARIALELKGKVGTGAPLLEPVTVHAGVEDALHALGYTSAEIRQALTGAVLNTEESSALREALQLLRRP